MLVFEIIQIVTFDVSWLSLLPANVRNKRLVLPVCLSIEEKMGCSLVSNFDTKMNISYTKYSKTKFDIPS